MDFRSEAVIYANVVASAFALVVRQLIILGSVTKPATSSRKSLQSALRESATRRGCSVGCLTCAGNREALSFMRKAQTGQSTLHHKQFDYRNRR